MDQISATGMSGRHHASRWSETGEAIKRRVDGEPCEVIAVADAVSARRRRGRLADVVCAPCC